MDNTTTPTDTAKTAANRVFVLGRDGNPLAPCKRKHAWKLIKARRVRKRWYLADDLLARLAATIRIAEPEPVVH